MKVRQLLIVIAFGLFAASCETIKGVGRDIENAGEALEDAVDGD